MPDNAQKLISMAREAFIDLTAAEEYFLRMNAEGGIPNFLIGPEENNDPADADQWSAERTIRADCIRWFCVTKKARQLIVGKRLRAMGAKIEGALQLDYSTIDLVLAFRCCSCTGKISFEETSLLGIDFWGVHVKSIYASRMKVSGTVHFWNGFVSLGMVNLDSARISGDLRCDSSRFIFEHRPDDVQFPDNPREAFRASGLEVNGFVSFNGSEVRGAICLYQASIAGNLSCDGTRLFNEGGNALLGTGAKIGGAVYLAEKFFAIGKVNLEFTEIGGALRCENASFLHCSDGRDRDAQEPALNLQSSNIRGSVSLKKGFLAMGKVSLLSVTIGDHLDCEGGHFLNASGYAILGDNARVSNSVLLRNGFFASGTVRLFGAAIGRNLECDGGQFLNFAADALNVERAEVSGYFLMMAHKTGKPFVASGNLILRNLRVGGAFRMVDVARPGRITNLDLRLSTVAVLALARNSWPKAERLKLDGLVYNQLGPEFPVAGNQCIKWLRLQPKRPLGLQPYEQLAKVLKTSGNESVATNVLIAKQQDLRRYGDLGLWAKFCNCVLGFTIGHGYKPHYAFLLMIFFISLGTLFFDLGYRNHLITRSNAAKRDVEAKTNSPKFQPFIYSLDCFLPIIDLKEKNAWLPNADGGHEVIKTRIVLRDGWLSNGTNRYEMTIRPIWLRERWGGLLRAYLCVHTLLGWALTTLWVAGFTGLVRRLN
jgi:hypothetical protein